MLPLSLNMIRAAPEAWYCSRRKALSRSAEPAHFPSFSDFICYQSHTWLRTVTSFFHRRCCRWSSDSFSLSTFCIAGIQLWETIMVRHGLMLVGQTVSGKTEVENALGLVERSLLGISSCLDGCGKRSHNWLKSSGWGASCCTSCSCRWWELSASAVLGVLPYETCLKSAPLATMVFQSKVQIHKINPKLGT